MNTESSLTSPSDRDLDNKWKPEQGVPPLTNEEAEEAMKVLNVDSFVKKFPAHDRVYQDPPVPMQNIGLFSFIPSKGATPDKKGIFGFAKLRGNFASQLEANDRAEHIIRNVDSYHNIFHAYVGRPFPVTLSSDYSAETVEVDIRKDMTETISENIKSQKLENKKISEDMQKREAELLKESAQAQKDDGVGAPPEEDPYERYITLQVKKAQLSWTFMEHLKKLEEVRNIILKTRQEVSTLDESNPEFKDMYFQKYQEARESAGFNDKKTQEDNFIKFMVQDTVIPTIDTNEKLPKVV